MGLRSDLASRDTLADICSCLTIDEDLLAIGHAEDVGFDTMRRPHKTLAIRAAALAQTATVHARIYASSTVEDEDAKP